MKILLSKKMYLPALSIVAGVVLLLALFGVSTYRNLDRQKAAAMESLHNQAIALLQALEAGARAGMMMSMWHEDSFDALIREISRNDAIDYIYMISPDGKVSHYGGTIRLSDTIVPLFPPDDDSRIREEVRSLPDGSTVYELAKRFQPYPIAPESGHHRQMMPQNGDAFDHSHASDLVVVGLRMTGFSETRQADLHHAFMMVGVLLLLGTAALFFIFVIQNFYLVHKTLKQTKDYTQQVLASMANGLIGVDPDGRITSYNHRALELLGVGDTRLKEKGLNAILDYKATGIDATLNRCEVVLEKELIHQKPSGGQISLALSTTPILDEAGACLGAVLELRDLTEIKRLETNLRRAEKLAAIGQLAAGVAHEIRNPLSSIRGFAQFLKHALKGHPQEQDYAAIMVEEVDRINRVVSDLLSLARPLETKPLACSITELINHVARLVANDAHSRNVTLAIDMAADIGCCRVDPNQLTQALLNLLLNALQAVEPGGFVRIGADTDEAGGLRIRVSDDGHGIPREQLDKIFDPFFTTRSRGTGLGLAIVHQIVDNHNGEIRVESPVAQGQRGSCFTIRIPAVRVAASQAA
ncbi:MAG: PAS domain-containing protein [Deltaproteobacteria bacterium]|nr:PAS domain-containing protein [Deltaproteobacteria bacterium]